MRFDAGTTDVPTAGTAVQISNTSDKLKAIVIKAPQANAGAVYFGRSDVSATNGIELTPGDSLEIDFGEGSEVFSAFYVNAAISGDDAGWGVIY